MFDVIVIGGGVVGGLTLRELAKYRLSCCMLEKESDVCMGASKANSGIVHAGFDAAPGSLKAKFNVEGNRMMPSLCAELGVKYRNNGSLVVAFSDEETGTLKELKERGEKNGVPGLKIIGRDELRALEENVSDEALAALYAPTGGIVCPYGLTIAAIGNAMDNGSKLYTGFEVTAAEQTGGGYTLRAKDGREVCGKVVINCAGLASGRIAALFGDEIAVGARKGEYILLDRESGDFVHHTLFFTPTKLGKGILVTQTADNNILLGPTAEETQSPDTATCAAGLAFVQEKVRKCAKIRRCSTPLRRLRACARIPESTISSSKKAKRPRALSISPASNRRGLRLRPPSRNSPWKSWWANCCRSRKTRRSTARAKPTISLKTLPSKKKTRSSVANPPTAESYAAANRLPRAKFCAPSAKIRPRTISTA